MGTRVEEDDFQVDKNNLGKEWLRQPLLYLKYAQAAADARRDVDECKNALEVTRAEISLKVRKDPEKFGILKATEAGYTSAIEMSKDVKNAQEDFIVARHDYEILLAAVGAMDHRKKALENFTSLYLSGYFSDPKAKEGESEAVSDMRKQEIRRRGKQRD